MDLRLHDVLELKKEHPCGSKRWQVLRLGMDIKLLLLAIVMAVTLVLPYLGL